MAACEEVTPTLDKALFKTAVMKTRKVCALWMICDGGLSCEVRAVTPKKLLKGGFSFEIVHL